MVRKIPPQTPLSAESKENVPPRPRTPSGISSPSAVSTLIALVPNDETQYQFDSPEMFLQSVVSTEFSSEGEHSSQDMTDDNQCDPEVSSFDIYFCLLIF